MITFAVGFLRSRNGTWENTGNQGGIRPGHYWSNWPLCNALAVISIGILCDDVFIYNWVLCGRNTTDQRCHLSHLRL